MPLEHVICPACDSASVDEKTNVEKFEYKGAELVVDNFKYSFCNECGTEFVTPKQRRTNDQKLRDKQRLFDGLLQGREIKRIRNSLGLTQHYAAFLFGGGINAFSKYEKGDVVQSVAMDRLLRVTDVVPGVFEALILISAKQRVSLRTRQIPEVTLCAYGECRDSELNVPQSNIIPIGSRSSKKQMTPSRRVERTAWQHVNNE
ncbi:MAG: type II toxin-antitoxin system MqsA family antitoxin [Thiogranum sp.]|nr:type II toxin-antitoxin system MqsA family antitoxin [Thiogranum sp.]